MAWFARSIANSLLSPEEVPDSAHPDASASPSCSPPRGVREDLSELTGALANRFQGLASFLSPAAQDGAPLQPEQVDIAGRFRAGLARLPGRQAVADLAKIASSLLPPELDEAEAAAGVTEEVVTFVRDGALRPELWLDFPFVPDDADSDGHFEMTDEQQDHALAVESMAPELADLRIELCPSHMSEDCFWKIYFVLLHPKLGKEDAEVLSTPQILEAREKLSHDLPYQRKLQSSKEVTVPVPFSNEDTTISSPVELLKNQDDFAMATSFSNIDHGIPRRNDHIVPSTDTISNSGVVSSDNISSSAPVQLLPILKDTTEVTQSRLEECTRATKDAVAEEQPVLMSETASLDKSPKEYQQRQTSADVNEQSRVIIQKIDNDDDDADDGDEWLEEEETGVPRSTTIPIADDDDVSFSDLEEEDDGAA